MTSRWPFGSVGNEGWLPLGFRWIGQWMRKTKEGRDTLCEGRLCVETEGDILTIEIVESEVGERLVERTLDVVQAGCPELARDL